MGDRHSLRQLSSSSDSTLRLLLKHCEVQTFIFGNLFLRLHLSSLWGLESIKYYMHRSSYVHKYPNE